MQYIKMFNAEVNKNKDDRFHNWREYRAKLSLFFKEHLITSDKKKSLLIVGAGNCDDIDLCYLSTIFEEITLVDADITAMENGVKKYDVATAKIELVEQEFTGFAKTKFFENLIDTMVAIKTKQKLKHFLDKELLKTSKHKFLSSYDNYFSTIIVTPIYTQLFYQQVLNDLIVLEKSGYNKELISFAKEYLLEMMPLIITGFNRNLKRVINNNGLLVVLSDIFESKIEDAFYKKVISVISDKFKVEEIYKDYVQKFGYGLGDYGLYSLKTNLVLKDFDWFIWPISKTTHLIVKGVLYV